MRIEFSFLIRFIFLLLKVARIAVYLQFQLVVDANSPENIDDYVCARNEAKLITLIYKIETEAFVELKTKLACLHYIKSCVNESFFSYGYNKDNSVLIKR